VLRLQSLLAACLLLPLLLLLRSQVTALLLSVVWGLAVFGVSYGYWSADNASMSSGIAMGALAFFFGVLTVSFMNSSEWRQHVAPL
jgi:predicted membrane channel-forming protein YqfA (hemolysin III family)